MIVSTTTGMRYSEYRNENSYRNLPFSSHAALVDSDGAILPTDVIVDAVLYPIVDEVRPLCLMNMDCASGSMVVGDGVLEFSGVAKDGMVELYDNRGRHAGTVVLGSGWERETAAGRRMVFPYGSAEFAAAVCCPVVYSGVTSLSNEDGAWHTSRKRVVLTGDDSITPVLSNGELGPELRFDAQYTPDMKSRSIINQLVFAAFGTTFFSIADVDEGTVEVYADGIEREDICWEAHREDSISTVVDACEGDQPVCPTPYPWNKTMVVEVCASDIGNVNVVADDFVNYGNPIRISAVEGGKSFPRPQVKPGMSREEAFAEARKILERPITSGNGILIEIPGLSNGK